MPKVGRPKRKQTIKNKKPRQKQKQKQIVKQNVKVNVQSSGGSGGLGGASIPTQPQYIPQYIPQTIPHNFRDTRGEDVILQKLSEVVDKFNSKPEPVQELPKPNPQPTSYIDGAENAESQMVASNSILNPKPNTSNSSIQKQIEDAKQDAFQKLLDFDERLFNLESKTTKPTKPKISIPRDRAAAARKAVETRKRNAEAKQNEKEMTIDETFQAMDEMGNEIPKARLDFTPLTASSAESEASPSLNFENSSGLPVSIAVGRLEEKIQKDVKKREIKRPKKYTPSEHK